MINILKMTILVFLSVSIMFAQKHSETDTLVYSYSSFHKEYSDSLNGKNYTIEYLFSYPIISNSDLIMENVNEFIFGEKTHPSNIDTYIQKSISVYKEMLIEEGCVAPYYEKDSIKVIYNENEISTLCFYQQTYNGQIHPLTTIHFRCFNLAESKQLKLSDLFEENYYSELTKIGKKEFYTQLGLPDTANLKSHYFRFDKNQFKLNENFYINYDGLHFFYNQLEISGYASGAIDLVIPWSKIKHLLNKDILNRI